MATRANLTAKTKAKTSQMTKKTRASQKTKRTRTSQTTKKTRASQTKKIKTSHIRISLTKMATKRKRKRRGKRGDHLPPVTR